MTAPAARGRPGSLANAALLMMILLIGIAIVWQVSRPAPLPPYVPGTPIPEPVGAEVIIAAGDIATCDTNHDEGTARVVEGIEGTVLALGDNAYETGSPTEYRDCYGPTWGRFKDRTRPVPGNHEYETPEAAGYFGYFGAAVGTAAQPWYAYDLGAWRLYALDSECSVDDRCDAAAELAWIQSDLASNPRQCVLAYWHQPRFSSGRHGDNVEMQSLWAELATAGADVVLQGHDHLYERFAPIDGLGDIAPATGIRSWVLGTGGGEVYEFHDIRAGSEVRDAGAFGVLVMTLRADSYDWRFASSEEGSFFDSGTGQCH